MSSANTLTSLIPSIYAGVNVVAQEPVGLINAVAKDINGEGAGKDQVITVPIVPSVSTSSITAGAYAADSGGQVIGNAQITMSNLKKTEIMWSEEEKKAFETNGTYSKTLEDQFAEGFRALRNDVEGTIAALYYKASRAYGTAGTTPFASSMDVLSEVDKILTDNGAPKMGRSCVVNTAASAKLRSLASLNNAAAAGGSEVLRQGNLIDIFGFGIKESSQIKSHTKGTATGMDCTAVEPVGETTITVDGSNSGTILAGDIITNTTASDPNKYVVQSATASGAADGNIIIAKPGLLKATTINDELVIGDSYVANMAFHRNAFQLVARPAAGGDSAVDEMFVQDPATGLIFRVAVYKQYMQTKIEIQLCWGIQVVKPEFLTILLG